MLSLFLAVYGIPNYIFSVDSREPIHNFGRHLPSENEVFVQHGPTTDMGTPMWCDPLNVVLHISTYVYRVVREKY